MLRNPGKFFIRKDVQEILVNLTGSDLSKIFKPKFNPKQKQSQIELLTDEQLKQENQATLRKATKLLQMPPFLSARQNTEKILEHNEELNPLNFTKTNYVFTDISLNVPNKNRMVVVREPNGLLRKANYEEREKMLQVYFPRLNKPTYVPKMFDQINLEQCLKLKNYLIVLNKACLRFEPNDPEFIRVTHRVYEYINEHKEFETLYSTRFYGPMMFYLAWFKKVDFIVAHLLNKSNLNDCVEFIRLYNIVHEREEKKVYASSLEMIENFVANEMKEKASSELALVNFRQNMKKNKNSASAAN